MSGPSLLDYFVSAGEQGWRYAQPKVLCRLEIDRQLKLGWLHHRQVGGLFALEHSTGQDACLPVGVDQIGPIAHQPAGDHILPPGVAGWNGRFRGEIDDLEPAAIEERLARYDKGLRVQLGEGAKSIIEFVFRAGA